MLSDESRVENAEDEELARAAKEGNWEARNNLFLRLEPLIRRQGVRAKRMISMYGRGPLAPEDIDQQAFIIFCDLLAEWEPGRAEFVQYMKRLMRWRLVHYVRSMAHYRSKTRVSTLDERSEAINTTQKEPADNTGQEEVESLFMWTLRTSSLEERWRKSLGLRFYMDLPRQEIAAITGLSVRTVDRDLHAALSAVRDNMLEEWQGCE